MGCAGLIKPAQSFFFVSGSAGPDTCRLPGPGMPSLEGMPGLLARSGGDFFRLRGCLYWNRRRYSRGVAPTYFTKQEVK